MSLLDWVGIISGVIAIATSLFVGLKKFNEYVVKEYLSELKPNGGNSLADKIRLEILPILGEIRSEVSEMKGRLDQHIKENKDQADVTPLLGHHRYPRTTQKGNKMDAKLKAMLASYGRSFVAAATAVWMTGNHDITGLVAAGLAAVLPVAARAVNPKDPAFGIVKAVLPEIEKQLAAIVEESNKKVKKAAKKKP